jgi:hypothetical protein
MERKITSRSNENRSDNNDKDLRISVDGLKECCN